MAKIRKKGFTLIEILLVMGILGLMLSVGLPISYEMYKSYKASLKAEEVMVFVSGLKRESFLYNETQILSSEEGVMVVNGVKKIFGETWIQIDEPVEFYKNGTTSGGVLKISVRGYMYFLGIQAPMGNLSLERGGVQRS